MKIAVVGGKLQGIEAVYLAHQAGWEVLLIDKNADVPAKGLADSFLQVDITVNRTHLSRHFKDVNMIIPALENPDALSALKILAAGFGIPLAFDSESQVVTSSKKTSDRLFKELGLSSPKYWPECGFPVIVKPSCLSGSRGIQKVRNANELAVLRKREGSFDDQWVVQELLEGPSYSIEVLGSSGDFRPLQATVIEVDKGYDCKRVVAPSDLPESLQKKLAETAVVIAKALNLEGIMDVEVILHENQLKLLEIDARLPSQTPTAVLKSTGINMLELLSDIFAEKKALGILPDVHEKSVIFEHIRVTPDSLEVCGEHIMAEARPLSRQTYFFGADEALTDYDGKNPEWAATLIMIGANAGEVGSKRRRVIETIQTTFGLPPCRESFPE
ncbi:MAG: 3-methylornithine--L-lysine ligase PylC [Candidatus Aminicenantes bacterium]|nr:3-methylornithine--L-lysine ligase PylC [Candidatus Aminicenantes bacterium]